MTDLRFDHLVLVAADVERTVSFYEEVLGAEVRDLERWRKGDAEYPVLHFGTWKINVHPQGSALHPLAARPGPGTLDFCLRFDGSVGEAVTRLSTLNIKVEWGPVLQTGARGLGTSVYFRDPDGNLLELMSNRHDSPETE